MMIDSQISITLPPACVISQNAGNDANAVISEPHM